MQWRRNIYRKYGVTTKSIAASSPNAFHFHVVLLADSRMFLLLSICSRILISQIIYSYPLFIDIDHNLCYNGQVSFRLTDTPPPNARCYLFLLAFRFSFSFRRFRIFICLGQFVYRDRSRCLFFYLFARVNKQKVLKVDSQ